MLLVQGTQFALIDIYRFMAQDTYTTGVTGDAAAASRARKL